MRYFNVSDIWGTSGEFTDHFFRESTGTKFTCTFADTGTGANTGSSRTGVGTGTPGSVGKPSGSQDWGAEDEVPYGEASLGKRCPSGFKTC